jgi:tetratricopeptide (TPR) repeat protein
VTRVARDRFTIRVMCSGSLTLAGYGFVAGSRHIVTCAHVANRALGRQKLDRTRPEPDAQVVVDLPLLTDDVSSRWQGICEIEAWEPPPVGHVPGADVAGLVLVGVGLPPGAGVATMISAGTALDAEAKVYGVPRYPPGRLQGAWSRVKVTGSVAGGLLQLDVLPESAIRAQPGFSGSPVVVKDEHGDAVLGMFAQADRGDRGGEPHRDTYAIPAVQIVGAWPGVLGPGSIAPSPYWRPAEITGANAEGEISVRGPAMETSDAVSGPREAALEAANVLVALDETARGFGTMTAILELLIAKAAIIGQHSDQELQDFSKRIGERGLDPRLLIPQLPGHEEAARWWASRLDREEFASTRNFDPLAVLSSFVQALSEELASRMFVAFSQSCRSYLGAALAASSTGSASVFVTALEDALPARRSSSRELVLVPPKADESDEHGSELAYRQRGLSALAVQMCRLPDTDQYTVGRTALVTEIVLAIQQTMARHSNAVAFLSGQPGVGTSTVAIEAARELAPAFPGGVFYVDLRGLIPGARRDAITAVRMVSEAMSLRLGTEPMEDEQLFSAFARELADKRVLIVLDDAKDADHLKAIARAPKTCAVIATSRDRRQDYASQGLVFQVTPLARQDSIQMLARFRAPLPAGESELDGLARLCDDLPLALRLVGAWMASRPDLEPGYLVQLLAEEITRLDYLQAGERAVRASIRRSYDNLDQTTRRAFRLIAAAPGATTSGEELGYCLGEAPARQERILNRLTDRSLATQNVVRTITGTLLANFSLFELVRLYARERLDAEEPTGDVQAFQRQSVTYLRDRLREIIEDSNAPESSGELDPARFHAAERLAEDRGWLDLAVDLLIDLHVLYFTRREVDGVARVAHARIAVHVQSAEYDKAVSSCLLTVKRLRDMQANSAALDFARRALQLATEYGLPIQTAEAEFQISILLANQGDLTDALAAGDRSASALTRLGQNAAAIPVAFNNCKLAIEIGAQDQAVHWGRIATDLADRHGDAGQQAHAAMYRGRAEQRAGNYSESIKLARRSASLFEQEQFWWNAAVAFEDASRGALASGDVTSAVELTNMSADMYLCDSDPEAFAYFICRLIDVSALQVAEQSFGQALATLDRAAEQLHRNPHGIDDLLKRELYVRRAAIRAFANPTPTAPDDRAAIEPHLTDAGAPGGPEGKVDPELDRIIAILHHAASGLIRSRKDRQQVLDFLKTRARNAPGKLPLWLFEELGNLNVQIEASPGPGRAALGR